jgi:hypothetical protein
MRINFSMSARFAGDILPLAAGDIKTLVVTANINSVLSMVFLLCSLIHIRYFSPDARFKQNNVYDFTLESKG